MHFLRCAIPAGEARIKGVVSRVLPGGQPGEAASVQTLVACGRELRPLIGADALGGMELGSPLQLYADPAARDGEPAAARRPYAPCANGLEYPVWDPHTSAVYMLDGHAILRLSGDNTVTVVAGTVDGWGRDRTDGPGRAARFRYPRALAVDGAGSLYVADVDCVRKVQLSGVCSGPGAAGASPGGLAAAAAAATGGEALVSTLPLQAPSEIWGLAFHCDGSGSGSVVYSSESALYRLPLDGLAAGPLLLAGAEGVEGAADGRGADARFGWIGGIALDGEGGAYVADVGGNAENTVTSVRRVAADGTVTTIIPGDEGWLQDPAILPNGCLALCSFQSDIIHVLGLGLKPPACHAAAAQLLPPAAPAGPPPRSLPADLGALLDRQPDGTADVTIVVGGRSFHAHRVLLSARSNYFRQILGGGFAEGGAQELSLPEADPDAFELWLRFVYTGTADIPMALAAAVAELAARLLMPELREQAAAAMEASVSTGTVAGLLLWAEARGPAFSELLSRLKAWFVENHEAVMREAAAETKRILVRNPDLVYDLMCNALSRPAKRPREC